MLAFNCLIIPVFLIAGLFLIRAMNAETRPGKIGTAAAAVGLIAFIPALICPLFQNQEFAEALAACGVLTLLLACAAIFLSVWAFRCRRFHPSTAGRDQIIGLVCGVANVFCGAGILAAGSGLLVPTSNTPWTWRSAEHRFEVTVPSDRWVQHQDRNVLAQFVCDRPEINAMIAAVQPAKTDAEFEKALHFAQSARVDTPTTDTEERSGLNRHGHEHWLYMGNAKTGDQPFFFGISVTKMQDKAIVMVFEGVYRLSSGAGHAREALTFRTQCEDFLTSVK